MDLLQTPTDCPTLGPAGTGVVHRFCSGRLDERDVMKPVALALLLPAGLLMAPILAGAAEPVQFNRHIRPILAENCYSCHGPDSAARQADLRLDQRQVAVESGAVVPGKPQDSAMIVRVFSQDPDEMMPPRASHKTLSRDQKELLRRWVAGGAEYQAHWSFIAPARPKLPDVKDKAWPRNAIDYFILARLEQEGLRPAPEADRRSLARRAWLDLTGLAPLPAVVDTFAADSRPEAYEKLIDQLLDSKHWGEHRARYWLDAARYADTHGLHFDNFREMWSYRDWVIEAFNRNQPFDQFTTEQLAADLLPNRTEQQWIATGFNRCNITTNEGGTIAEENLVLYTRDRTETVSQVWLGLTAGCAACHDHRFDPLSQREFYQMSAFFNNTTQGAMDGNVPDTPPILVLTRPEDRARWAELGREVPELRKKADSQAQAARPEFDKWLAALPEKQRKDKEKDRNKALRAWLAEKDRDYKELASRLATLEKEQAAIRARGTIAHVVEERSEPPKAFVLFRGEYDKRREQVGPATPAFLPPMTAEMPRNRLGFARWLLHGQHPLTARVTVNRFWQEVFGAGIVRTAGDFGATGEMPSHPELLDWLAVEFRESGWDVKKFFRLMLTSATYRQAAVIAPETLQRDPQNRVLSRGPRFRMDAEMLRDYALAASGLLVAKIGGPSTRPYQPPGVWEAVAMIGSNTRDYRQDQGENLYRRSLYTFWKRAAPPAWMEIFNAPSREVCTVRRERTNTPLQALATLNDPQWVEAARHLAQTALQKGGADDHGRLELMAKRLLARALRPEEAQSVRGSLARLLEHYRAHPEDARQLLSVGESRADPALDPPLLAAWTMLANELMNTDEVLNK